MRENLCGPVEWGYENTGSISVIVYHKRDSVVAAGVGDCADVPEMARRKFVEYHDITRLPVRIARLIVGNKLIRENRRISVEKYFQVFDTSVVDILVSWILVKCRIFYDVCMNE